MPANTRAVALCLFFLVAIHCVTPPRVFAQCGGGYVGVTGLLNSNSDISAVFSGTVAETQALDAVRLVTTFDVDAIWKGRIAKRAIVYQPIYKPPAPNSGLSVPSGGLRPFEMGKRYLVVAHNLSDQEKRELGVQSDTPGGLAVGVCGSGSMPYELFAEHDLKQMGPSRKPQ